MLKSFGQRIHVHLRQCLRAGAGAADICSPQCFCHERRDHCPPHHGLRRRAAADRGVGVQRMADGRGASRRQRRGQALPQTCLQHNSDVRGSWTEDCIPKMHRWGGTARRKRPRPAVLAASHTHPHTHIRRVCGSRMIIDLALAERYSMILMAKQWLTSSAAVAASMRGCSITTKGRPEPRAA